MKRRQMDEIDLFILEAELEESACLHQSYKVQDGCHNCARVFIKGDYEEASTYFCTLGAELPRPRCCSVSMNEWARDHEKSATVRKAWERWSFGRHVEPQAICDNWMS